MAISDTPDVQTDDQTYPKPTAIKPPTAPLTNPIPTPSAGTGQVGAVPLGGTAPQAPTDPLAFAPSTNPVPTATPQLAGAAPATGGWQPTAAGSVNPNNPNQIWNPNVGYVNAGTSFTPVVANNYANQDVLSGNFDQRNTPGVSLETTADQGQFGTVSNPLNLNYTHEQLNAMTPQQRQAIVDQISRAAAGRVTASKGENPNDLSAQLHTSYNPLSATNLGSQANDIFNYLTQGGAPAQRSAEEDAAFRERYGLDDPNYVSPADQSQAALTANANANSGYSTIQGGQTFTDPTKAAAAKTALDAQVAKGGPSLFTSQQEGGTINADALKQLQTGLSDASGQSRVYSQFLGDQPAGGILSQVQKAAQGALGPGSTASGGGNPLKSAATGAVGGGAQAAGGGNPLSAGEPSAAAGRGPAFTATNIDPENALMNQVITPGAGVDRYQQAKDALENYRKGTEAGYKADSDTIAANSFGAGRGVSGMNRTRQGDLALARANDLNTKGFDFLNNALTGSIEDKYRDIGIGQQQQGYQKSLSDTAFEQDKERALLEDALTNSSFGRALSQQTAGYANSPEQYGVLLSKIFGDQSSAAGQAAQQAFRNAGGGSPGFSYEDFLKFVNNYKSGAGTTTTGAPAGGYVDDTGGVYG